jgi:integrase
VKNYQARHGAITEAENAGVDLDDIRSSVGHTTASTTARYLKGGLNKSKTVSQTRVAARVKNEQN